MHAHRHCSKGDGKIDSTAFSVQLCLANSHRGRAPRKRAYVESTSPTPVDVVHLGLAVHVCCAPCLVASLASSVDSM